MPRDLLLEIGAEEIPAGFLARALVDLRDRAEAALAEARLETTGLRTVGTPRRLTLIATGIADRQPDVEEEVVGPPARVAFDEAGAPTKAAVGFADRNRVEVSALRRGEVAGKKGEYVLCTRREAGRDAVEVLPALLADLIATLPWPKSMRWAEREEAFVRPVQWLVCLLGGEVLPLGYAGVQADRLTRGHRFLAPDILELDGSAEHYEQALREAFVIVDPAQRRTMIQAELTRIETETGATVRPDEALLAEVANLVEYPVGLCGGFSADFLEVPEEVIVSAMRSHQRYFAMSDLAGRLANRFVTIAGTITRDVAVVRAGNERVLAARLADAQFFFREDRKRSLDDFAERLDSVVFQKKLGSIGDKVRRVRAASRALAERVGVHVALADRAAALCKADLTTHMVGEFPDLQGDMGRHYARLAGEKSEVCDAIAEHYQPRGAGDDLPAGDVGALIGLTDRLDTIVGCFAAGLAPTGSADPYGLRRAALGVLRVLTERQWPLDLAALVAGAAAELEGTVEVTEDTRGEVLEFLRVRFRGLLADVLELPADCVDAALAVGFHDPHDARARAEAVARLRARADFEPLAVAFKRVANILKGQPSPGDPAPDLLREEQERALWSAFQEIHGRVEGRLESRDYHGALQILTELGAPVDQFFDAVLVMDDDARVRQNRLALLGRINDTFNRIADFRQLAV